VCGRRSAKVSAALAIGAGHPEEDPHLTRLAVYIKVKAFVRRLFVWTPSSQVRGKTTAALAVINLCALHPTQNLFFPCLVNAFIQ